MQEWVGHCTRCNKDVYCFDGFLNGVYKENRLYCFACDKAITTYIFDRKN